MIKVCEECGKEYNAYRISQKYCSTECKNTIKKFTKICVTCGKEYRTRLKNQKCCSPECGNFLKRKRVKIKCKQCGKEFEKRLSSKKIYCSPKCVGTSQRNGIERTCKVCGKKYKINSHRIGLNKCCSYKCKYIDQKRRIIKSCLICGKKFVSRPSEKKMHCSYKCWRESLIGINNPNYHDGKSTTLYPLGFNKTLKEKIRERDNYTCQICGIIEKEHIIEFGKVLSIHHCDYKKDNLNEDNLITLCNFCNSKVNSNREYWTKHFQKMMRRKKLPDEFIEVESKQLALC